MRINARCANLRFRDIEQHCVWSNVNWRALFNRLNVIELNFIVCFGMTKEEYDRRRRSVKPEYAVCTKAQHIDQSNTANNEWVIDNWNRHNDTNNNNHKRCYPRSVSNAMPFDSNRWRHEFGSSSVLFAFSCNVWSSITPFVCDERLS